MDVRKIQKIETDKAPRAVGPYSQAIKAYPFLFVSGMVAIDPKVGKIVETTIEGQTRQVLANIEEVLKAAALTFLDVVRMEVFLKDLGDFQSMNAVYAEKFPHEAKPARHAFQVVRLPLDALVEITCTALCK
jgi:2-iminobutanoate/2-iminopropanoate deaminase